MSGGGSAGVPKGTRDTAKDIILGLQPSGLVPKEPRTGKQLPPVDPPDPGKILVGGDPVVEGRLAAAERNNRSLLEEIVKLQNSLRAIQQGHADQIAQEQEARRRLEASLRSSHDALARLGERSRVDPNLVAELEATKQSKAAMQAQILRLGEDLAFIKRTLEQHSSDLQLLNSEIRSRPQIDPTVVNLFLVSVLELIIL